MNWIKRKVIQWVRDDWNEVNEKNSIAIRSCDVEATMCDAEPILNFRVFSAVGGRVVEFRQYDRQKDRSHTQTYIITNEQDFGEAISKISTMELMKT